MRPRISDMTQELQVKYAAFAARMGEAGIPFALNCVLRTEAEQEAFYAQGREPIEKVNELRKAAGMYILMDVSENIIVTYTKRSLHFPGPDGKSRAWDIMILRGNKKPTWDKKWDGDNDGIPDYQEAASIGRVLGLRVGADWGDYPHFECGSK